MALIGKRIGAVTAPVCWIRKEVGAVDVVLFRRIVDRVRPGVRRIQLARSAAALLKSHIQGVVVRVADGFSREDVVESLIEPRRRAKIGPPSANGPPQVSQV